MIICDAANDDLCSFFINFVINLIIFNLLNFFFALYPKNNTTRFAKEKTSPNVLTRR